MKIEFNPHRVANLLKKMVNQMCEEGFVWYEDVGDMPTIFDINHAIKLLDDAEVGHVMIGEDK